MNSIILSPSAPRTMYRRYPIVLLFPKKFIVMENNKKPINSKKANILLLPSK